MFSHSVNSLRGRSGPGTLWTMTAFPVFTTKRSLTRVALALVCAGVSALASLAGPTATASATASIDMLNFLDFNLRPGAPAFETCSAERTIPRRGTYRGRDYYVRAYSGSRKRIGEPVSSKPLRLTLRGRYRWIVCIRLVRGRGYEVKAVLRSLRTGGRAPVSHIENGVVYGDGYYDWGSTIDRVR
jgi:hypothetical protein